MRSIEGERDVSSVERPARRWLLLVFILVGQLAVVAATAIVNVALPVIRADFDTTPSRLQWALVSFQIAFATLLVIGGRVGDLYGQRRVLMIGLSGFTLASIVAAMSPNVEALIATRLVQGALGGMAAPQVVAMIRNTFPADELPRAYGYFGLTSGGGYMLGQLAAGFLIRLDLFGLGWRSAFLVNIVLGAIAIAGVGLTRAVAARRAPAVLDVRGALLIGASVVALLFPVIQARELGYSPVIPVLLVTSTLLFVRFLRHERGLTRRDASPLIDLRLFVSTTFTSGLAIIVTFGSMSMPSFVILTIAVQSGWGLDPLETAMTLSPGPVFTVLAASLVPRLTRRWGDLLIVAAGALCTVAAVVLAVAIRRVGTSVQWYEIAPVVGLFGFSHGFVSPYAVNLTMSGVEPHRSGAASGVMQTAQQLSAAIAIAAYGLLFYALVGDGVGPVPHARALSWVLVLAAVQSAGLALLGWRIRMATAGRTSAIPGVGASNVRT